MAQPLPLLYLVTIPGMGYGYRANRFLPKGTLVLQELPVILLPQVNMPLERRDAWIEAIVARMPPDQLHQFLRLQIAHRFRNLGENIGRFLTNALPCEEDMRRPGLFLLAARFNSSCTPNVHQYWDGKFLQFRTMADIQEGQELFTCNYTRDLLLPMSERQVKIEQSGGYHCQCVACVKTGAERLESDRRRARIAQALAIANHGDFARVRQNFRSIFNALQDLRAEGLYHYRDTLLYDGYRVCRTAGDGNNAMLWLLRAYEAAVVVVGDQNPQVQATGRLLNEAVPQQIYFEHWVELGPPPQLN